MSVACIRCIDFKFHGVLATTCSHSIAYKHMFHAIHVHTFDQHPIAGTIGLKNMDFPSIFHQFSHQNSLLSQLGS